MLAAIGLAFFLAFCYNITFAMTFNISTEEVSYIGAETADLEKSVKTENETENILRDLVKETGSPQRFAILLMALALAMFWVLYVSYYNSRIVGKILTAFVNRFYKTRNTQIHIGSFSVSVLSGKILFRDIQYITTDYALRIQDGFIIFMWWRKYEPKDPGSDFSHADTRLLVQLNGFELHVYNRSFLYSDLEKKFGLSPLIILEKDLGQEHEVNDVEVTQNAENAGERRNEELLKKWWWRDLIPIIKVDITSGRFVAGNHQVPTTLVVTFDQANAVYYTKKAPSSKDLFTHIVECKLESSRVLLSKSPRYRGEIDDEPPRFMGEGFVVMSSHETTIHYYQDEPGYAGNCDGMSNDPECFPYWGINIKCGRGTNLSYGPWVDRQRDHLYKFFFPSDYQIQNPTEYPIGNQLRIVQKFDFKLSMQEGIETLDILFLNKENDLCAIHSKCGKGSFIEVCLPWVTNETGFSTHIRGILLNWEATTNMQFRSLIQSETLDFQIDCLYPLQWNLPQSYTLTLTGTKATGFLVMQHVDLFGYLINDWASKTRPDVYHFVPYDTFLNIELIDFEILLPANQFNWVDCDSQHLENMYAAVIGNNFRLKYDIPFGEFLPKIVATKLHIQGEACDICFLIPKSNSSSHVLKALEDDIELSSDYKNMFGTRKWRNFTQDNNELICINCWSVPLIVVPFTYNYHPCPPLSDSPLEVKISTAPTPCTTPEMEEHLLFPLRVPANDQEVHAHPLSFDPSILEPDKMHIEVEFVPSEIVLYGTFLKILLALKENYFGDCDNIMDFNTFKLPSYKSSKQNDLDRDKKFDSRKYRPLNVSLNLVIHGLRGHLAMHRGKDEPPCPTVYVDRLCFELHRQFSGTMLQLLSSPIVISVMDNVQRIGDHAKLKSNGHLCLSCFQLRGQAMFSHKGLLPHETPLEYAWLLELQFGELTGKLTSPQLLTLLNALQTIFFLVKDSENSLQSPTTTYECIHKNDATFCSQAPNDQFLCPSSEDTKYSLCRISVDCVSLFLVESGAGLSLRASPFRLSTCNLYTATLERGLSAYVDNILLQQFLLSSPISRYGKNGEDPWIEVGSVNVGPIVIDSGIAIEYSELVEFQQDFLKLHDAATKRLNFLWQHEKVCLDSANSLLCGCKGGCVFFGSNESGKGFFDEKHLSSPHFSNGKELSYGKSLFVPHDSMFPYPTQNKSFKDGVPAFYCKNCNVPDCKNNFHHLNDENIDMSLRKESSDSAESVLVHTEPHDLSHESMLSHGSISHRGKRSLSINERQMYFKQNISSESFADSDSYFSADDDDDHTTIDTVSDYMKKSGKNKISIETDSSEFLPALTGNEFSSSTIDHRTDGTDTTSLSSIKKLQYLKRPPSWPSTGGMSNSSSQYTDARIDQPSSTNDTSYHTAFSSQYSRVSYQSALGSLSGDDAPTLLPDDDSELLRASVTSESTLADLSMDERNMANDLDSSHDLPPVLGASGKVTETKGFENKRRDSNSSKFSATGFNNEDEIGLVDLHGNMVKPITESFFLMSSYKNHLSQLKCSNWTASPPNATHDLHRSPCSGFNVEEKSGKMFVRNHVPKYIYIKQGLSPRGMTRKKTLSEKLEQASRNPSQNKPEEENGLKNFSIHGSTIVIKFKQSIDIVVTPLLLEALTKYVESFSTCLSNLSPFSCINIIHEKTQSLVKSKIKVGENVVKKSPGSSLQAKNDISTSKIGLSKVNLHMQWAPNPKNVPLTPETNNSDYLDSSQIDNFTSELPSPVTQKKEGTEPTKILFELKEVKIIFLQCAVGQDKVPFSLLETFQDLTCVSLFVFSLQDLSCVLQLHSKVSEVTAIVENSDQSIKKNLTEVKENKLGQKFFRRRTAKKKKGSTLDRAFQELETVPFKKNKKKSELVMASVSISKINFQMRRLKNNTTILDKIIRTTIPEEQSKVCFEFSVDNFPYKFLTETVECCNCSRNILDYRGHPFSEDNLCNFDMSSAIEPTMGFIMVEGGLEKICVKGIFRLSPFETTVENVSTENNDLSEHETEKVDTSDLTVLYHVKKKTSQDSLNTNNSFAVQSETPSGEVYLTPSEDLENLKSTTETDLSQLRAGNSKNSASFKVDFGSIWFNFAAPPSQVVNDNESEDVNALHKQLVFSRFDWNLLSTFSPSLDAWLLPGSKLGQAISELGLKWERRVSAITAGLLIEAINYPELMDYKKPKFQHKFSKVARILQQNPSCQLLTVLRRYLCKFKVNHLEAVLSDNPEELGPPDTKILQKGIIALTREWKHVLYNAMLESSLKSRAKGSMYDRQAKRLFNKPKNVAANLKKERKESNKLDKEEETHDIEEMEENSELSFPSDEKTGLLPVGYSGLSGFKNNFKNGYSVMPSSGEDATIDDYEPENSTSTGISIRERLPTKDLMGHTPKKKWYKRRKKIQKVFDKDESDSDCPPVSQVMRHHSLGVESHVKESSMDGSQPDNVLSSFLKQEKARSERAEPDLYSWMAGQQDQWERKSVHVGDLEQNHSKIETPIQIFKENERDIEQGEIEDDYHEDDKSMQDQHVILEPNLAFQLTQGPKIFAPLLDSLGLKKKTEMQDITKGHNNKLTAIMENLFEGRASVIVKLQEFNLSIIHPEEHGTSRNPERLRHKIRTIQNPLFLKTKYKESPVFKTDSLSLEISVASVNNSTFESDLNIEKNSYDHCKQSTLSVHFSIRCSDVSQHISLPLLRLLHQIKTMGEKLQETRREIKDYEQDQLKETFTFNRDSYLNSTENESSSDSPPQVKSFSLSNAASLSEELFEEIPKKKISPTDSHVKVDIETHSRLMPNPKSPSSRKFSLQRLKGSIKEGIISNVNKEINSATVSLESNEGTGKLSHGDVKEDIYNASSSPKKPLEDEIHSVDGKKDGLSCWQKLKYRLDLDEYFFSFKEPNKIDKNKIGVPWYVSVLPHSESNEVPVLIFGMMHLLKASTKANISGLKLEAQVENVICSITHREQFSNFEHYCNYYVKTSLTTHVGGCSLKLFESIGDKSAFNTRALTVLNINVGTSYGMLSCQVKNDSQNRIYDLNNALITIGVVSVDIPQHPVALHGMVTRSTKRISHTLQELESWRLGPPSTIKSRSNEGSSSTIPSKPTTSLDPTGDLNGEGFAAVDGIDGAKMKNVKSPVIRFNIFLNGFVVGASLIPSLKAEYRIDKITSHGITGSRASFSIDLKTHHLSFSTKDKNILVDSGNANVDLPGISVLGEYKFLETPQALPVHIGNQRPSDSRLVEGLMLRSGYFFDLRAEMDTLKLTLSTDLLNHLMFVMKVFQNEVNDVFVKMSRGNKKRDQTSGGSIENAISKAVSRTIKSERITHQLLYSLHIEHKGIVITATAHASSAVRLETDKLDIYISNRIISSKTVNKKCYSISPKIFVKASVDLEIGLGNLVKNHVYEETDTYEEADLNQLAFFKTRIGVRNALPSEMISSKNEEVEALGKEAVLISLARPVIMVQSVAFDKAVVVWMNYKNAYDYWQHQRAGFDREIIDTAQRVFQGVSNSLSPSSHDGFVKQELGINKGSMLFLQLTVEDLGICLPLVNNSVAQKNMNSAYMMTTNQDLQDEGDMTGNFITGSTNTSSSSVVVTLESTQISACSTMEKGVVSKGIFRGFCVRFADGFTTSLDNWNPEIKKGEPVMDACVVPNGTYEICSRTKNVFNSGSIPKPKLIWNIQWIMKGIDVHMGVNIGRKLSNLFETLTTLTEDEKNSKEDFNTSDNVENSADVNIEETAKTPGELETVALPSILVEGGRKKGQKVTISDDLLERPLSPQPKIDRDWRRKLLETQISEQGENITTLKQLGASKAVIDDEMRKLQSLEAALRRDVLSSLRRQSIKVKAEAIRVRDEIAFLPRQSTLQTPTRPKHTRSKSAGTNLKLLLRQSGDEDFSLKSPDSEGSETLPSSEVVSPLSPEDEISDRSEDTVFHLEGTRSLPTDQRIHSAPVTSRPSVASRHTSVLKEEKVDFELDIKVVIDSGRCVLHPKQKADHDDRNEENRRSGGTFFKRPEMAPTSSRSVHYASDRPFDPHFSLRSASGSGRPGSYYGLEKDTFGMHPWPMTASGMGGANAGFNQAEEGLVDTVFLFPGVDVRVKYHSADSEIVLHSDRREDAEGSVSSAGPVQKKSSKKGKLYVSCHFQKLPDEMSISPSLVDFLTQALDPIPFEFPDDASSSVDNVGGTTDEEEGGAHSSDDATDPGDASSGAEVIADANEVAPILHSTFSVDVVVYVRVEPSTVRFTCVPTSRVECIIKFPTLDLTFSYRDSETNLDNASEGIRVHASKSEPTPNISSRERPRTLPLSESSSSSPSPPVASSKQAAISGTENCKDPSGLSFQFSGSLSNFSLLIFHPFGGPTRMTYANLDATSMDHSGFQTNAAGEAGRKEYMSLNVESIQVSISRSRQLGPNASSLQFSTLCDIGSANFNYDMRRLVEILDFPKAWYRKAIIRRMFLGETSMSQPLKHLGSQSSDPEGAILGNFSGESESEENSPPVLVGGFSATPTVDVKSIPQICVNTPDCNDFGASSGKNPRFQGNLPGLASTSTPIVPSNNSAGGSRPTAETSQATISKAMSVASTGSAGTGGTTASSQLSSANWDTFVLVAVNLKKMDIQMNMSNAMGNTVWTTTNLRSHGRLLMGSSGKKDLTVTAGFEASDLEARGGIVGGVIDVQKVETTFSISESSSSISPSARFSSDEKAVEISRKAPSHSLHLRLDAFEGRVDFMGSSILMGRLSALSAAMADEWKLDAALFDAHNAPNSPEDSAMIRRRAQIYLNCELAWERFHVMITRSTTPDLIRLSRRLTDFFSHQFQSGKKVLESIGPGYPELRGRHSRQRSHEEALMGGPCSRSTSSSTASTGRHHRHWQRPLSAVFRAKVLSYLPSQIPKQGTLLGGTMRLRGEDLSLACFSGINFRSNKWAVFYLSEPTITFTTEAQFVKSDPELVYPTDKMDTSIEQDLLIRLGNDLTERQRATIYRFSREKQNAPTHASTLREWFNYTFASLPEMDAFPHRARERSESVSSLDRRRKFEYKHNAVDIFALPCMQCRLTTNHMQTFAPPSSVDEIPEKAVVNCSFYTSFENHIQVRMDAELFFFLHELVQNYMHECEKATGGGSAGTKKSAKDAGDAKKEKGSAQSPGVTETETKESGDVTSSKSPVEASSKADSSPVESSTGVTAASSEDWREFVCKTWHLNPTLSFLTAGVWAEPIEPSVGVDYVLNKLGFKHANTTIPKWTQRGVMDPMDKILSVMMHKFIISLKEKDDVDKVH